MTTNCKVQLKGNLGQGPKIVCPENGKEFIVLSVATTDSYKDKSDQWVNKETLWHDVLIFNPAAIKAAKELNKGDQVNLEGTLSYKQVETKDGYKVPQASIIASFITKANNSDKEKLSA